NGPLLRVILVKMSDEDHVVLDAMDHIITDGWSQSVLVREVATLYDAYLAGEPSPLPELPIQYADFAVWQREWLQGETLETQLSYWREQLAGVPHALELPTDRPRPPVQSFHGQKQSAVIPRRLTDAIVALSRQEGATLFMTMLAAFKVLLSRYANQEDVSVGF